jgi:phospholipase/carboxylesterase
VTINGGYRMRAWYDILGFDAGARQDEDGIRESEAATRALVLREAERGIPAGRVVLAGFSQGGAIALHTALRHPVALAGVIALSSYLPLSSRLDGEGHPANARTPIFMGHGTEDDIVPLARGRQTRDLLLARGAAVEWHEYPMPHSVSPAEIRDLGAWLRRVLPPADPAA